MADQTIEMTEEAVDAVATKVAEKLDVEKIATDAATKAAQAVAAKSGADKPVNKLKGETGEEDADDDEPGEGKDKDKALARTNPLRHKLLGMGKEGGFAFATMALVRGNDKVLREYNMINLEKRAKNLNITVEKLLERSGYGNETTGADGGFLVPDPDFDAEVERLEEQFGVAARFADFGRVNGNAIKMNKKASGFELFEIADELDEIPGVKFSIAQVEAQLRKFGGIAPASNEIEEDAAVDYWNEVAKEFARANSKKQDQLVFTDTHAEMPGILEVAGTAAQSVGANPADIDWDDLMNAETKVPSDSAANGRWYIHRTFWNLLMQKKSSGSGEYFFQPRPGTDTSFVTPWGTPVTHVEVLPAVTDIANGGNQPFAVFGDLSHSKLRQKRGLVLTMLDQATVKDVDGNTVNLALQDAKAMRGIVRMLAKVKFANAFCVLGTGSVS